MKQLTRLSFPKFSKHTLRRAGSAAFALTAAGLMVFVILWSPLSGSVFRWPWEELVIATACAALSLFIDLDGWHQGIRNFRNATDQVTREIQNLLKDDDDNGPSAC